MDKNNILTHFSTLLEVSDLPFDKVLFWNELQRKWAKKQCGLTEFFPDENEESYIRFYPAIYTGKSAIFSGTQSKHHSQEEINNKLKEYFTNSAIHLEFSFWEDLEKDVEKGGFFFPIATINQVSKSQISQEIEILEGIKSKFPFVNFLKNLKKKKNLRRNRKTPFHLIVLWEFYFNYIDFLKDQSEKEAESFAECCQWIETGLKTKNFTNLYLPLKSCNYCFYMLIYSFKSILNTNPCFKKK